MLLPLPVYERISVCAHTVTFHDCRSTIIVVGLVLSLFCSVCVCVCACSDLALVNIMLLAGMGIDLKALVQRTWTVALLSVVPTIGEVAAIALVAVYVLQMPLLWSILLG